jgi:hypothetical protein
MDIGRRGRRIKNKGYKIKDFNAYFIRQLGYRIKGSVSNRDFEEMLGLYEKSLVIAKL